MNGRMPVLFGEHVRYIAGGPYADKPPGFIGIKMAAELPYPADVFVPSVDFGTPTPEDMREGVAKALWGLAHGYDLYAGCKGGIGRTGTFLACLAKVTGVLDPVGYVRSTYLAHAVETVGQRELIAKFPVNGLKRVHYWATAFVTAPSTESAYWLRLATEACFRPENRTADVAEILDGLLPQISATHRQSEDSRLRLRMIR